MSMKLARIDNSFIQHGVVASHRYLDDRTRDIVKFVEKVNSNEIEIEQNLQSHSMKLKSSH